MAACSYSPIILIFPSYAATPNPLSSNTNYLYPVLIHRDRFLPFNIGHNWEGQNLDKSFLATSSFAFLILQYRFLGCILVSFWGRKQVANTGCNTELDRPYNVSDWRKKSFCNAHQRFAFVWELKEAEARSGQQTQKLQSNLCICLLGKSSNVKLIFHSFLYFPIENNELICEKIEYIRTFRTILMMKLMNEQKSQEMMKLMNEQVKVSGDGGREGNWPTIVRPTPRPSYQVSIFTLCLFSLI